MGKIWRDEDIDPSALKGRTVGIIGYGIQGRAQALNLRDSGVKVVVGGRESGKGIAAARKDGFEAFPIGEAAVRSDVLFILTPDETHAEVLTEHVTPALKKGDAIGFACGFSLTFSKPPLPKDSDVIMVSPKGPGKALRQRYLEGGGLPALVAIARDATGGALDTALAYAKAIGCGRLAVIESSFEEEAHTDLFGEQAVLCGGIPKLMEAGFLMLVEAGYSPESAYIECVWETKAIVDLIFERGIEGMYGLISPTARYGGLTRGGRVIDETARGNMREILDEIRDGTFARELPEGAPRQPGAEGLVDARLNQAWLRLKSAFGAPED
jgi:ketol-acid reductoisomerase